MFRSAAPVVVILAVGVLLGGARHAAAFSPPAEAVVRPHLKIADAVIPLDRFIVSSTTCGQIPAEAAAYG